MKVRTQKNILILFTSMIFSLGLMAQSGNKVIPAAERINVYLPLIKGKSVGIFANQTSMVGNTHLVDTLRSLGVNVKVIFGPEH
ncbi:MAG TPA: hypothetical protein PLZ10_13595, partial [Chitinophagaceae bacterium]|nr:hypothetical protein [Chitinophagaceae bacterium]